MDIVEQLKQEFSDNALKDVAYQTHVYVKERHEAAEEIERLREALKNIVDRTRDVEKSYVSLLHEIRSEARKALGGE